MGDFTPAPKGEGFHPSPKPVPESKRQRKLSRGRGKYAEKRVAEKLGGRLTLSSGRTSLEKGDVRVEDMGLFVEVKYVGERVGKNPNSITFPKDWMMKTLLDAKAVDCLPVVALRFAGGGGVYCADADTFELLVSDLRYLRSKLDEVSREINAIRGYPPDPGAVGVLPPGLPGGDIRSARRTQRPRLAPPPS